LALDDFTTEDAEDRRRNPAISRREALRCMCGGIGMIGLADLLAGDAFAAAVHTAGPHFAPRAKHVILISELLPNLATVADELCVIRSMFTTNPNHEQACSMFHQGSMILSASEHGLLDLVRAGHENKNLPVFIVLAPTPAPSSRRGSPLPQTAS
jgi:hypothetical protein